MEEIYIQMIKQLASLLTGETNTIANLANATALLNQTLDTINWVGFYLYNENTEELLLGPFQGKVACTRIPLNQGVCGTSAYQRKCLCINNVHNFNGHIACDRASNSEIVIPIIIDNYLFGVLDIDSPILNRFSNLDCHYLQIFIEVLKKNLY